MRVHSTIRWMIAAMMTMGGTNLAAAQEVAPAKAFTKAEGPAIMDESRIERVTADLSGAIGEWRGVRSCGRTERATEARQAAYERWIGQQTLARPRKILLEAGVREGKWSYRNGRRASRARFCTGSFTSAPAYAHFY